MGKLLGRGGPGGRLINRALLLRNTASACHAHTHMITDKSNSPYCSAGKITPVSTAAVVIGLPLDGWVRLQVRLESVDLSVISKIRFSVSV